MAVCRRADRPLLGFLASPTGLVLVAAVPALVGSMLLVVHEIRRRLPGGTPRLLAIIALNLWALAIAFAGAEAVVRGFAVSTPEGPVFVGTPLLPKSWESVAARHRAIARQASAQGSYLVFDPELGWTVGPNRRSGDYNEAFVRRYLLQHGRPLPSQYVEERSDRVRGPLPAFSSGR